MSIYVGVGGWTFEPWRKTFYPADLPHARELYYASRQLTAIEVNGTFYRTQSAATFAKWRDETPDGFVFTLKAPRYTTHRKTLDDAGAGVERFVTSGIAELREKLGPILWSFPPWKTFNEGEMRAFLTLLPHESGGLRLRHAIDARHETFVTRAFADLAAEYRAAIVFSDTPDHGSCADLTADFFYARLKRTDPVIETGYSADSLDAWATRIRSWARGVAPPDLHCVQQAPSPRGPRDGYVFFISGAKERAPAAARALIERLR